MLGIQNLFFADSTADNQKTKKPSEKQISSGYSTYARELMGHLDDLEETSETALEILSMKVAKKLGDYNHEDENIQELIRSNIKGMEGSLKFVVKDLVENGFLHGFAGAEIVYKIKDNKVYTKKLQTFTSRECTYNYDDKEFQQDGTTIPNNKLIFYDRKKAKLKQLDKLVNIKKILIKLWCLYTESYVSPLLHGKSDDVDELSKALENIHLKKTVITDLESELEAIKLNGGGGKEFLQALEYIDKLIYRIFYLGGNFSSGEKTGTTANANVNENIIDDITDWIAEEIREILIEQWVRKLIDYNFIGIEDYGKFALPNKKDVDVMYKFAQTVKIISDIGLINIDDFNVLREKFDLPEIDDEKLKKLYEDEEVKKIVEAMKKDDKTSGVSE